MSSINFAVIVLMVISMYVTTYHMQDNIQSIIIMLCHNPK